MSVDQFYIHRNLIVGAMKTESKENLVPRSGSSTSVAGSVGSQEKYDALHDTDSFSLTATEKRFLLLSERGDVAGVRDLIAEFKDQPDELNINCVDPLNRSSLISGIENENIDMIRLLLDAGILVKVSAVRFCVFIEAV